MARRRNVPGRLAIDLGVFLDAFWRVAGAIVLETLAFVLWNVGSRSPVALARAMRDAFKRRGGLVTGIVSALVGFIFIAAATILVLPAVADIQADFVPIELATLLAALALEFLIGNDLRKLVSS